MPTTAPLAMVLRTRLLILLVVRGTSQGIEDESCVAAVSHDRQLLDAVRQAEEISSGDSLLAHRVSFRKALSFAQAKDAHRAWRDKQIQLEREVNESQTILDSFIDEQSKSGDACSSRLMESKRTLDGLLHDLKEISLEVASHEKILETETENLNITYQSIDAVNIEVAEALKKCKKEREEAVKEVAQYSAELEELVQIAEPSVRYHHSVKKINEKKTSEDTLQKLSLSSLGAELVEKSDFTREHCLAFMKFAKRHDYRLQTHMSDKQKPTKRACDEQRQELQEAFTKAYLEVKDLLTEAKDRVTDETCFEAATAKKAAEMVPLVAQRDQSAGRIEYSSAGLAATEPVLALVTDRSEQLRDHIKTTLTPECKAAGEVTEMLEKVRELIVSLSECPGRDDFTLKIPKEEKTELIKEQENNNDFLEGMELEQPFKIESETPMKED